MTPNRLSGETSPYLLQHAANPVDWHPWDDAALTLARDTDTPILLSVGYSACHWCHVMAHESFENPEVAAVMNRHFINIKVDREERPDIDQIYQSAQQMLNGRNGGWPLTMFLAPDGTPFFGGTYFPPTPRYGLPAFADLCRRVAETYRARRADIEAQNNEFRTALNRLDAPPAAHARVIDDAPIQSAIATLEASFDARWGGFGGAPKFPHPPDLALLLNSPQEPARHMALTTLQRMQEGGIYDHIGGGFARYSVDERWEIPHFEKMLYDNALLLPLYADAWALTGAADFRRVVEESVEWITDDMTAPCAAFYSSRDADSEGEEGRFYVWQREELDAVLSAAESALVARRWGFADTPNFEHQAWHPKIAGPLQHGDAPLLERARRTLQATRAQRVAPARDEKILSSWNALMIRGLTHAARVFGQTTWLTQAQAANDYLRRCHWRDGRLLATSFDGRAHLAAYLDDYAFLLAAQIELMQAEFRHTDLQFAIELAEALLTHFEDPQSGGFYFTAHDHERLIQRTRQAHDNATPAGNGIAVRALLQLGHLLGEPRYLDAAERCLRFFWPRLQQSSNGYSSMLTGLHDYLHVPPLVILRGPDSQIDTLRKWQRELGASEMRMVLALPHSLELPATLAKPVAPHVNAWVCRGVTCMPPIANFDELKRCLGID